MSTTDRNSRPEKKHLELGMNRFGMTRRLLGTAP